MPPGKGIRLHLRTEPDSQVAQDAFWYSGSSPQPPRGSAHSPGSIGQACSSALLPNQRTEIPDGKLTARLRRGLGPIQERHESVLS